MWSPWRQLSTRWDRPGRGIESSLRLGSASHEPIEPGGGEERLPGWGPRPPQGPEIGLRHIRIAGVSLDTHARHPKGGVACTDGEQGLHKRSADQRDVWRDPIATL